MQITDPSQIKQLTGVELPADLKIIFNGKEWNAKDLVELDGAKEKLILKDSSIATLESRVANKDSVIVKFQSKESTYKNIIMNQDTQIKDWKNQYQTLYLQNQKLKFKNKITKIGAGVVVGGLVYLMIAK